MMHDLRDRELEILRLVATGASNKEIAVRLNISTNTVKVHLRNIFSKIGVSSRTEAAMFAVNNGLVPNLGQLPMITVPETVNDDDEPETATGIEPNEKDLSSLVEGRQVKTIRLLISLVVLLVILLAVGLMWMFGSWGTLPTVTATRTVSETRWVELAQISPPRFGLALVAYEDQLIAIGGQTEQEIVGTVDRYDPLSDRWKSSTPKPVPVANAMAVVIGGKIYVPGGETAPGEVTDICEVYDPAQDQWASCQPLNSPRSSYGLTTLDGSMYLFGGWDGRNVVDTVFRYRPDQDKWEELPRMPTARRNLGVAAAGRKILVIGGEDASGPLPSNEIFYPDQSDDPQTAWSVGSPLPQPVSGMGVVGVADIIYVVGGHGVGPLQYPVMSFDDTRMWRVIEDIPFDLPTHHGLAGLGKYLYLVGGKSNEGILGRNARFQVIFTVSFPIIIQ